MTVRWQKLLTNLFIWTISEATLNVVGLDTMADYSEFLLAQEELITVTTAIAYL